MNQDINAESQVEEEQHYYLPQQLDFEDAQSSVNGYNHLSQYHGWYDKDFHMGLLSGGGFDTLFENNTSGNQVVSIFSGSTSVYDLSPGSLFTSLSQPVGTHIDLSFDVGRGLENSGMGGNAGLNVYWQGKIIDTIYSPEGSTHWVHKTYDLVASGGEDTIGFSGVRPGAYEKQNDTIIDSIHVTMHTDNTSLHYIHDAQNVTNAIVV